MSLTKLQARELLQHMVDDPSGVRWPEANIDMLMSVALDTLYVEVLQTQPYAVSYLETPSMVSPGTISKSGLTKRLFRIQKITRNGQEYSPAGSHQLVIEDNAVVRADDYTYVVWGDNLHVFPYDTTADVELRYSYLPAHFRTLDDSATVEWPDGHDLVYLAYTANLALGKGAAEDGTNWFLAYEKAKQLMMAAINRYHPGPITILTADTSIGWGSVT